MARAKRQVEGDDPEDNVVDEPVEAATISGEISQGDEDPFLVELAKELGYKEAEEWEREPGTRLNVRDFLKDTPKVISRLKESSERSARAAAEAIEEDRRRAREEATRVIETSEDPIERKQAAQRLADNAGPPPETQAWMARNPWFHTDPDAQALAVATVNRMAQRKASIADQLSEAEAVVRKRFPEYFAPSVSEQRLSDVRRSAPTPPQVQQGTRATVTQVREKGFAQIPRADREAFNNLLLRKFMSRGLSEEQAQTQYAKSYWRDPPEDPSTRENERFPMQPTSSAIWSKRRAGR